MAAGTTRAANTMKALVKSEPRPGLWMRREPVPEIGPVGSRVARK